MITRTLLIALALFLAYNLILSLAPLPGWFVTQSQWQENIAKAQDYLLAERPHRCVLVGTSLAARLSERHLGPDFRNVSFSGGSPITGLELVRRSPGDTQVVVIETNLFFRDVDDAVLSNAFRPALSGLRSYLPALQEKYQPANFIAGKLGEKLLATGFTAASNWTHRRDRAAGPAVNPALCGQLLSGHRKTHARAPDPALLKRQAARLQHEVRQLEALGISCVFVEMPVDRSLMAMPLDCATRACLMDCFPPAQYRWIQPREDHDYRTTDGLHLTGDEARAFAAELRQAVLPPARPNQRS